MQWHAVAVFEAQFAGKTLVSGWFSERTLGAEWWGDEEVEGAVERTIEEWDLLGGRWIGVKVGPMRSLPDDYVAPKMPNIIRTIQEHTENIDSSDIIMSCMHCVSCN